MCVLSTMYVNYHYFDSTVPTKNIIGGGADHRKNQSGIFHEEDAEYLNSSEDRNPHVGSLHYI